MLDRIRAVLVAPLAIAALAPAPTAAWADDHDDDDEPELSQYDSLSPDTAWQRAIGLRSLPGDYEGQDVTIAVLDTGVTRHPDIDELVARVDLMPDRDGYDRYGHGTHVAGVIAGDGEASGGRWTGVAPEASLLPVRVAGWNGATDVSAVLAGLEWIAAHRARYGIRVVNLSYGTDSSQPYLADPLNRAVERLWDAGVLVIVSAGNRGEGDGAVEKPGDDPFVLTVGAADTRGTATLGDDVVAPFSSRGPTADGFPKPDLVAPGVSIVSHRATGSTADALRPAARVGDHYFKGTGTSQAAAVVSGVAALMLEANPRMTPDEVKAALVGTASRALAGRPGAGAGMVDAAAAVAAAQRGTYAGRGASAGYTRSSGLGKIDRSRGSYRAYADWRERGRPEPLAAEVDFVGRPWDATAWASRAWTAAGWASSPWAPYAAVAEEWEPAAGGADSSGLGWDAESWTARYWGDLGEPWVARYWGSEVWNGAG
jgi:serine protease AprX